MRQRAQSLSSDLAGKQTIVEFGQQMRSAQLHESDESSGFAEFGHGARFEVRASQEL
jgi:hypothetical protein